MSIQLKITAVGALFLVLFLLAAPSIAAGTAGDYDGDGKADIVVFRPVNGHWFIIPSSNPNAPITQQWGTPGDIPVPGDYDGDGKTDIAVWRPSTGTWFILPSSRPGTSIIQQWGTAGDIPVPGDYDGDGKTDIAVWRPSSGTWFILPSNRPGTSIIQQWGAAGDVPVPGDYDGDGKTDFAVWRSSNGTFYVTPSSNPSNFLVQQWGVSGDKPVPGDYDGDGKTDFAVWRPSNGTFYVIPSSNPSNFLVQQWGVSTDIPVPADYDGDKKTEFAVWRPSNGTWYVILGGNFAVAQWGVSTDLPLGTSNNSSCNPNGGPPALVCTYTGTVTTETSLFGLTRPGIPASVQVTWNLQPPVSGSPGPNYAYFALAGGTLTLTDTNPGCSLNATTFPINQGNSNTGAAGSYLWVDFTQSPVSYYLTADTYLPLGTLLETCVGPPTATYDWSGLELWLYTHFAYYMSPDGLTLQGSYADSAQTWSWQFTGSK
jgi:hypothetical protein